MKTVQGMVEWKGDKWNGAVSVEGERYNFKKGVDHSGLSVGDYVELTLAPWEFKGKKGLNVVEFKKIVNPAPETAPAKAAPTEEKKARTTSSGSRDFDKEARGKTFCAYLSAMLSNPNVPQDDLDKLFVAVDKCVERTFQ
jgi:hypothetical protein